MVLIQNRIDRLYTPTVRTLIREGVQLTDSFIGLNPHDYKFPLKLRKPEFNILSRTLAGFNLAHTEEGLIGEIWFNPTQFIMVAPRESERIESMKLGIIEETVHALHTTLNQNLIEKQRELNDLINQKEEHTRKGMTIDAELSELFNTNLQLANRIRKVADYFGIPTPELEGNEAAFNMGLEYALASSEMDYEVLKYVAEYLCEKLNINKKTMPKPSKKEADPERSNRIYLASFIRSILNNSDYFPTQESKLRLAEEFDVVIDYTTFLKIAINNYLFSNIPEDFLNKAKDYIEKCDNIHTLWFITDFLRSKRTLGFDELKEIYPRLYQSTQLGDIKAMKDDILLLFNGIEQADIFIVMDFIKAIIKGEDKLVVRESGANAIALYEFGDLPADPIARDGLLKNPEYVEKLLQALHSSEQSPLVQTGLDFNAISKNPNDDSTLEPIAKLNSISEQLDFSAYTDMIRNNTSGVWDHLVAINANRIISHKNKIKDRLGILEFELRIKKLKNEMDIMYEPIAKVIKEFLVFGKINPNYILEDIRPYSDFFKIGESTLILFIEKLIALVTSGDKAKIKEFMRQPGFIEQLAFLGIEA